MNTVSILEVVAKYVGRTSSAYRYIAEDLKQLAAAQVDSCRCIDCGGDQPGHSKDCTYMAELVGVH